MCRSNECGARFNLRRMDRLLSMSMFVSGLGVSRHGGASGTAHTGECHDKINAGVPHRDRPSTATRTISRPWRSRCQPSSRIWLRDWLRSRSTSADRAGGPSRCCRRALRRRSRRCNRPRDQPDDQRDGAIVMGRAIALLSRPASDVILITAGMAAAVEVCRRWTKGWSDGYRPELHYMRGPGPKWREKHGHADPYRSSSPR